MHQIKKAGSRMPKVFFPELLKCVSVIEFPKCENVVVFLNVKEMAHLSTLSVLYLCCM